jgi:Skp family chaperone for outer membrane proteins
MCTGLEMFPLCRILQRNPSLRYDPQSRRSLPPFPGRRSAGALTLAVAQNMTKEGKNGAIADGAAAHARCWHSSDASNPGFLQGGLLMLRLRHVGVAVVVTGLVLGASVVGAWRCGWLSLGARTGSVAIVDIEAVAKQLGADVALERQVKDAEASLNSQLASLQASLRRQYEDKSRELLAPRDNRQLLPADAAAAKQQLTEIEKQLNQQLLQAQQTARAKFGAYCNSLLVNFRNAVVPVAKKIAEQHGCGVVLTKNDAVLLAFDDSHDITNAVAEELRKSQPAANAQTTPTVARAEKSSTLR